MRQQLASATRILGRDVLRLLQRVERADGNIPEIADRCADQVELAGHVRRLVQAPPTPTASPKFWRRCSRNLPIKRDSSWRTRSRETPNSSPNSCRVNGSSAITRLSKIWMS